MRIEQKGEGILVDELAPQSVAEEFSRTIAVRCSEKVPTLALGSMASPL